ncbi:MAG: DUF2723 domain-containing protein [Bacteroidota bacterium]|nr:DUF2723 domain-containing protein [Bacteroidota bacterium]MDP4229812.1 DUF2723 domain-containing protein [Bacteroidota bacterium]MDP4235947.1 DUF2723 domain-containing protein [Bacteroidota bacterium]
MNLKRTHYLFAGFAFLVAFFTYFSTMQPSIPFWDCGEFAAAAWAMQIPHPPGSPLWTIVGRIAMMLPTMADPVARYNLFSVLASAATVVILYLTLVRIIKLWRGEPKSTADIFTHFGGALVGALAYCFTDSFWFNALECEVYAFGTFFIALIPWLMFIWYDHAEEEHSEKYLLLVAYVIGLSMGVHQLALLTIFPCFMLIYYRRRANVTTASWLGMVAASIVAFLIAYKIVLSQLVEWLGADGIGRVVGLALIGGSIYGIWYSQKKRKSVLNLSLWASMLLFVGYSTYTMMVVRANQNPPMNENAPRTLARLTSFINRDQYGYRPPLPRRALNDEGQKSGPTWTNYSSDMDFFWRYQTDHMYHRYLEWNFIGRENDKQDAGVDWSKTFGIPFLLGLFGIYWHFKRDKKRALTLLAAFIMLGWMTAWYQNQQDPQPRERDYFYVGAFYVYAMWIGIGATGIMEVLRAKKKGESKGEERAAFPIATGEGNTAVLGATLLAALILVPLNQCVGLAGLAMGKNFSETSKWAEYSRARNYIPFDYGYNILQSCEKDAILFTFGDNDTFPLWCLQDVYSIRRDVRIVQLSLSNIGWYIDELKNESPWGAKKVTLSGFSDASLTAPQDSPLAPHYDQGTPRPQSVPISAAAVRHITGDSTRGGVTLSWNQTGTFGDGKNYIFTVSDQLIVDILKNNIDDRPIYFSTSVPDNYRSGLDPYLAAEGMALRLTPDRHPDYRSDYGGPIIEDRLKEYLYNPPQTPAQEPRKGMLIRTYNDPKAHHSYLDGAYAQSYYLCFLKLATFELQKGNKAEVLRVLDTLDNRLPPEIVNTEDVLFSMIAEDYDQAGNSAKAVRYANIALKNIDVLDKYVPGGTENDERRHLSFNYMRSGLYVILGKYDEAIALFNELQKATNDKSFAIKADEAQALKFLKAGNKAAAMAKYDEAIKMLGVPEEQIPPEFKYLIEKRDALK